MENKSLFRVTVRTSAENFGRAGRGQRTVDASVSDFARLMRKRRRRLVILCQSSQDSTFVDHTATGRYWLASMRRDELAELVLVHLITLILHLSTLFLWLTYCL